MTDMQNNKHNNVPINNEAENPWDFIPVQSEQSQREILDMSHENILEALNSMKIVEAKHHSSKATEYFLSSYPVTINSDGDFLHNAKKYSKLEFLKTIQESHFHQTTFQVVLRKIITAWDNQSF